MEKENIFWREEEERKGKNRKNIITKGKLLPTGGRKSKALENADLKNGNVYSNAQQDLSPSNCLHQKAPVTYFEVNFEITLLTLNCLI